MKIIYYYSKLCIGGAEQSTVRLLNALARRGHDVTLLLRWGGGELEGRLDASVKTVILKKESRLLNGVENKLNTGIARMLAALWAACQGCASFFRLKQITRERYDVAMIGLFGYNPGLILHHARAAQYYQMLRNDVQKTGGYGKTQSYMRRFSSCFDAYLGVSKYTTKSFQACYPVLAHKAHTLYNILPDVDAAAKRNAPEAYAGAGEKIKILTVCRMCDAAKGLFRMVDACARLKKMHDDFIWYVVGDGPDKEEMRRQIQQNGLEDVMILCPHTKDPFDYYAHADLVAVLSYHEGLCGVVNEAKLMCKPVIATQFSAIDEQIENGVNGVVVENSLQAIVDGMDKLLSDQSVLRSMAINGLPEQLRNNEQKINQLEQMCAAILEEKKQEERYRKVWSYLF